MWGTDLEIYAAAAMWQVKICVCTSIGTPDSWPFLVLLTWIYFQPAPLSKVTYPAQFEELPRLLGIFLFELFDVWGCHYDVVVGPDGYTPLNPPSLPEQEVSYISLTE